MGENRCCRQQVPAWVRDTCESRTAYHTPSDGPPRPPPPAPTSFLLSLRLRAPWRGQGTAPMAVFRAGQVKKGCTLKGRRLTGKTCTKMGPHLRTSLPTPSRTDSPCHSSPETQQDARERRWRRNQGRARRVTFRGQFSSSGRVSWRCPYVHVMTHMGHCSAPPTARGRRSDRGRRGKD